MLYSTYVDLHRYIASISCCNLLGESCGQGTLIKLKQRIEEKGFDYVCYDVFGDPAQNLTTACAMGIINSVQQGEFLHRRVCLCVCVCVLTCMCVYVCVCACMHVCICAYIHMCLLSC